MEFKGYRDLECYKKGRELRISISTLVKKFPNHEKFLLSSQITDASRSVTSNIAEGYGRFTYLDTRNFFIVSRGSTSETYEHLQTALDENYITQHEFDEVAGLCELVFRLINGYIAYLNKQQATKKS